MKSIRDAYNKYIVKKIRNNSVFTLLIYGWYFRCKNPMEFHLATDDHPAKRSDYVDLNLKSLIKLNQHIKEIVSRKDETTTEKELSKHERNSIRKPVDNGYCRCRWWVRANKTFLENVRVEGKNSYAHVKYVFCWVLPKTEINFVVSNLLMIFRVGDDDMMKPTIVCNLHLNDRSRINCVSS